MSKNNLTFSWDDNQWKKFLEKPEDLLLTPTIFNMSKYLLSATKKSRLIKKTSYEKELVEDIQYSISKNSLESKLLKKYNSTFLNKLTQPLPQSLLVKEYSPIFKKIIKIENSLRFLDIIKNEFYEMLDQNDPPKMDMLDFYILQSSIERFSIKELKDMIKKTFAKTFFSNLSPKIQKWLDCDDIQKLFIIEMEFLLNHYKKKSKNIPTNKTKKLFSLHFNNLHWEYDLETVINEILNFEKINKAIVQQKAVFSNHPRQKIEKILFEHKFDAFFEELISKIFRLISNHVILDLRGDYRKFTDKVSSRPFSQKVSNKLTETIYDNSQRTHREFNHTNAFAVSESFFTIFGEYLENILENDVLAFKKKFIRKYSSFVFSQFKTSMSKKEIQDEIMSISNKWGFFQFLVDFIKDCSRELFFKLFKKIQKINNTKFISEQQSKFKQAHLSSLMKHLSDTTLFSLPDVSKSLSKKMIHSWFLELKRKKKKFRIFFIIGGIDCNFKIFKINNVHYFDGRKFHFKEGTKFDRWPGAPISINEKFRTVTETYEKVKIKKTILEKKRNSGRAYVDILAYDAYSAIEIAKIEVKKSFDDLVFASTSTQKGGFQPQLPIDFVYIEDGKVYPGFTRGPRENDSDMLVVDKEYDKIISLYDKLETEPPAYYQRLSRTLDWYHRGQWAQTVHEKFVSYWISLEHLILKQIDKDMVRQVELMEFIPKLTVTWSGKYRGMSTWIYFRGIEKKLQGKTKLVRFLDANKKFRNWRQNRSIILDHIDLLEPITTGEVKKCVKLIQKELKQKQAFRNSVRIDRDDVKFKVAVLIKKRNDIFHEGVSYSQELELLLIELRKIVIDVIQPHLKFQYVTSLKQMIHETNRPIQV